MLNTIGGLISCGIVRRLNVGDTLQIINNSDVAKHIVKISGNGLIRQSVRFIVYLISL